LKYETSTQVIVFCGFATSAWIVILSEAKDLCILPAIAQVLRFAQDDRLLWITGLLWMTEGFMVTTL
jgi:hypothetical protein